MNPAGQERYPLESGAAVERPVPALEPRKSPLAFGTGNFGLSIFFETVKNFAYFYYIDWLGLALVSAALMRTIFTIWDTVNDPIVGFLSDNTRTRWGRRQPWLVIALPFMMLVFVAVFSVPVSYQAPQRLLIYMLGIMLLYETLSTILNINYSALYPELFHTLLERTKVSVYYEIGNIFGVLVGLALPPLLFPSIGFSKLALLYAFAGGSLFFISLFYNREGRINKIIRKPPLVLTLHSILADRVYWLYIFLMILTFFSTNLVPFALPFYVKYSLQARAEMISLLSFLAMLSALVSMPVWTKLIKIWQVQKVFLVTLAVCGACMLCWGFFPILLVAALGAVLFGCAFRGINVCHNVIRASLISRHIDRTGNFNEAAYYGLMNSGLRLGELLQSLAMLLVGVLFGYVSGENPGPHPGLAFRFLIGLFPVAGLTLAALFARRFFKAFSISQGYSPR